MRDYFGAIFAIVRKDLLLELRARDILISMLVFGLLALVVFNFAIDPTPRTVAVVAPGMLWISFTFGSVLGLNRSFALEKDSGALRGLMLAPVGRDALYFGKMTANFLFMLMVEAVIYPAFAIMFNFPLFAPGFVPVALLATLGISAVGTAFSAMAVSSRSREAMLPVLFLPVAVPVIIGAVEATALLTVGGEDMTRWIPFLAAFDAVFLVVCPIAFGFILEE